MTRYSLFFLCFSLTVFLLTACGAAPEAVPPPNLTPPPDSAFDSLTAVSQSPRPAKEIVALMSSLQGEEISPIAQTTATPYQVGDVAPFWYKDTASDKNIEI